MRIQDEYHETQTQLVCRLESTEKRLDVLEQTVMAEQTSSIEALEVLRKNSKKQKPMQLRRNQDNKAGGMEGALFGNGPAQVAGQGWLQARKSNGIESNHSWEQPPFQGAQPPNQHSHSLPGPIPSVPSVQMERYLPSMSLSPTSPYQAHSADLASQ